MRLAARVQLLTLAVVTTSVAFGVAGSAGSPGTVSGTITQLGGGGLPGAVVTAAGPGQPPVTATTGGDGSFALAPGGSGPYGVGVQANGFASQSIGGVQSGQALELALAPATFNPLPIDGGWAWQVEADATTGVFYALMNQAPEIYRTLDYGGTWQSVTMSYDDPETGLGRPAGSTSMAASSVPGEVAVLSGNGTAEFSTDYGLTWRTVGGDSLPPNAGAPTPAFLFWGHASPGAPNVLMTAQYQDGGWAVLRANMSAATPTFVRESSDPFGTGSVIDVADSGTGSFVGRVNPSGELSFAPLTADDAIAFGSTEATGLPTPPVMLRLGGAKEPAAPPDGALVAGGSGPPFTARMLTKAAGANSFAGASVSGPTAIPSGCRFRANVFDLRGSGSVAQTSTGTMGAGNASECWLQKNGTADLTVTQLCCAALGDFAYDASWGSGNHVAFMAHPDGPHKSSRLDGAGVPVFHPNEYPGPDGEASLGTGANTGGVAVKGIASAGVADLAYGPSAQDVAFAVPGAQLRLASRDGGATVSLVGSRGWGANAVQWWLGASGEWLVFGSGQGGGEAMTALLNWDPSQPPINGGGNVAGSRPEDLGGAPGQEGYGVEALEAVTGTDTVFIGAGKPFDPVLNDNHLYRARLAAGNPPSLTDKFSFDAALGGTNLYLPQAMAYCPPSSAQENMRDVLLVAMGDSGGSVTGPSGGLLRIAGGTTDAPAVSVVDSVPNSSLSDVRADCATGVVYAAGMGGAQVYRSTDGGVNFQTVPIPAPEGGFDGPVTAIGLNPADPNDVTAAIGNGNILHSADATATAPTWAQVNDPTTQRKVQVNDIEFAPGASSPTIPRSASGDTRGGGGPPEQALIGTGGGAFEANVGVSSGIIAFGGSSGGAWLGSQLTAVTGDAEPSLVVDPAGGRSSTVFRRSNGLAFSATTGGSWSIPVPVPATVEGDDQPSLALDPAGGLQLAFRRLAGPAAGIYHMTRGADGVWSSPQRVSTKAGDSQPSLAVTGRAKPAAGIAFLRTKGRSRKRGVYAAVRSGPAWRTSKVPRTGRADARADLGGPALAARGELLHLAFARAGKARGVAYSQLKGKRWKAPQRLTRGRDAEPALAMSGKSKHVVFRRAAGAAKSGLYALSGGKRWKLTRVSGTGAEDREPALVSPQTGALALAFARAAGDAPGGYLARQSANGGWRELPQRVSGDARDHDPSLGLDAQGRVTVIVARG